MNAKDVTAQEKACQKRQALFRRELTISVLEANGLPADTLRVKTRTVGFRVIPAEFLYAGNHLSNGAKLTWLMLHMHKHDDAPDECVCWPSRERLAILVGCKSRQITTYLNELREYPHLLYSKRRPGMSSVHVLIDPPSSWMRETKRILNGKCPPPSCRPKRLGRPSPKDEHPSEPVSEKVAMKP